MAVVVTDTAIKAIEDAQGFDSYILQTPIQDLKSQLALDLRRKMLIALAKQDFHHEDAKRQALVYEKYKQHEIPVRFTVKAIEFV
jgi:large subunit ribosomal protein L28